MRIKMKNAIMQTWSQIKEERKGKSISDLVNELEKMNPKDRKKLLFSNTNKDDARSEGETMKKDYLTAEQFRFL